MAYIYAVLRLNSGTGPTKEQWTELLELTNQQPFPQFLNWAAGGKISDTIFNSVKYSQGINSDPEKDSHRFYAFGLRIDEATLINNANTRYNDIAQQAFVDAANYLRAGEREPYARLTADLTLETVKDFVVANNITVFDAGLAVCRAYEGRNILDVNWGRNLAGGTRALVQNALEFSLKQGLLASTLNPLGINFLTVHECWVGDDALRDFQDYLAADAASQSPVWYA